MPRGLEFNAMKRRRRWLPAARGLAAALALTALSGCMTLTARGELGSNPVSDLGDDDVVHLDWAASERVRFDLHCYAPQAPSVRMDVDGHWGREIARGEEVRSDGPRGERLKAEAAEGPLRASDEVLAAFVFSRAAADPLEPHEAALGAIVLPVIKRADVATFYAGPGPDAVTVVARDRPGAPPTTATAEYPRAVLLVDDGCERSVLVRGAAGWERRSVNVSRLHRRTTGKRLLWGTLVGLAFVADVATLPLQLLGLGGLILVGQAIN